ncbi:MAG TPA: hypothetical protein VM689_09690 [Aliidongia sp.]|nr:hypothetical protein [Aliidongia sp.]
MIRFLSTASLFTLAALTAVSAPSAAFAQTVNGVTYAPSILSPSTKGIVSITLQNNMTANEPSRVVTFGHVFPAGAVPAGSGLTAATAAGTAVPLAMTVKATHPDGSVRHAVISLTAPAVPKGAQTTINFSVGKAAAASAGIKVTDIVRPGWAPTAVFTFHNGSSTTTKVIDVASLATKAISAGTAKVWLNNSLVKEIRISTPLNAQMTATFDIRVASDGQIKTDMIVANDQAFTAAQSFVYDVAVSNKGKALYQLSNLTHYPYSNWHKPLWTGTSQSNLNVAFDPEYMARAGAVPEFDFSLGLAVSSIATFNSALASAQSGPMQSSLITPWMETTGGRPDIGPTSTWSSNYLVSQDQGARNVMLAQADDAGSVPWHLRDGATNAAISLDQHPTTWIDARETLGQTTAQDMLGSTFDYSAATTQGGWELDQAHEPDLAFVPYLTTGDQYYLDEMEYQASFLLLSMNPGYRLNAQGLFYPASQMRGVAWNLRDVSNAGWIAPDSDPLKATFNNKVANNISNIQATITPIDAAGSEGKIDGYLPDELHPGLVAPWQNDFVAMMMDLMGRRGVPGATTVEAWLDKFNSGIYTNGSAGYNPLNGPGYWLTIAGTDGSGTLVQNSWSQFYGANFGGQPTPTVLANFPDCTFCYPANSTMSSAEAFSATGSPTALWAYAFLVANTPTLLQNTGYVSDPSWHVTPILPDGYHLRTADIQLVPDSGGTVTVTGAHGLLAGGAGTNVLNGGSGVTIMYAGTGQTTMNVGSGTTYIVGGAGEGSAGSTAVINASTAGQAIVMDFTPGLNKLVVKNSSQANALVPLTQKVTTNAAGNAVLTLSPNNTVTLMGVAASAVNSSWVIMQ